jgi:hypothetical protein
MPVELKSGETIQLDVALEVATPPQYEGKIVGISFAWKNYGSSIWQGQDDPSPVLLPGKVAHRILLTVEHSLGLQRVPCQFKIWVTFPDETTKQVYEKTINLWSGASGFDGEFGTSQVGRYKVRVDFSLYGQLVDSQVYEYELMQQLGTLSGYVADATGKRLPGLEVELYDSNNRIYGRTKTQSANTGWFYFTNVAYPEYYTLRIYRDSGYTEAEIYADQGRSHVGVITI